MNFDWERIVPEEGESKMNLSDFRQSLQVSGLQNRKLGKADAEIAGISGDQSTPIHSEGSNEHVRDGSFVLGSGTPGRHMQVSY